MDNETKKFSETINKYIKELQFTNRQIARIFGVSLTTIQRWKDGINEPHPFMQKAIIEELHKHFIKQQSEEK